MKFLVVMPVLFAISHAGGYGNFLCPTTHNATVIFPCEDDCMTQHLAEGGSCGDLSKGDFNCYCGKPTGKRNERSRQCFRPHQQRYADICTLDCLCNHGATGGRCDWENKACICEGYNPNNYKCPVKTKEEFVRNVLLAKAGKEDLGPGVLALIAKLIPIPDK